MEKEIQGIIPPLLTPLDREGDVDVPALKRLIEHCIRGGVSGIFVLGSCGEGTVLSREQRRCAAEKALEITGERIPVLVGVLETSAAGITEEIKEYEEMGAEYFVAAAPYYLPPGSQEEILEHFRYITEHMHGKLIIYNIPPYTNSDILPTTMERLLEMPKVTAIKDSTGNWALFQKILFAEKKGSLLSGNEDLCGAAMLLGADGCVPCLANIYPGFYVDMLGYGREKNVDKILEYQRAIVEMKEVFQYGRSWIAVVKYLCARKGLILPYVGKTLPELTEGEKNAIEEYLKDHESMYENRRNHL